MKLLQKVSLPDEVMLRRIVNLRQAAEIAGVSVDSLKRHYASKIVVMSARRRGMRLCDVLTIGEPEQAA